MVDWEWLNGSWQLENHADQRNLVQPSCITAPLRYRRREVIAEGSRSAHAPLPDLGSYVWTVQLGRLQQDFGLLWRQEPLPQA